MHLLTRKGSCRNHRVQILSQISTHVKKTTLKYTVKRVTEQYVSVVLFIVMLYIVVLAFEFVDEILKCDYSNECC